jgi:hypothetical protein
MGLAIMKGEARSQLIGSEYGSESGKAERPQMGRKQPFTFLSSSIPNTSESPNTAEKSAFTAACTTRGRQFSACLRKNF